MKYKLDEVYGPHCDYDGSVNVLSPQGPRILTILVYLSDVEEGGETAFPELGIVVTPKKGMALIWPSVKSDDLLEREGRTVHESKPVLKGEKYVTTVWMHNSNWEVPFKFGCI